MGPFRPNLTTSSISWLLIGGEHLRKNLRKVVQKMEASDWLLKIVGRKSMTSYLKIAQKKLISLTSWDPCDPIFRSHDSTSESVGKSSGIFGKARGKNEGRGGWGKDQKKVRRVGWGGWVMTSSKKIQNSKFKIQNSKIQKFKNSKIQNSKFKIQNSKFKTQKFKNSKFKKKK